MATESRLKAGDRWRNDQAGKHGGWVVRVQRVTPLSVAFEVRGPSRSLTSRQREPAQVLLRGVELRRTA